jgi:hypothetical protein
LNHDNDIYARRYDAAGRYLAPMTIAASLQNESGASLSMDANGNFAVTYTCTLDGSLSTSVGVRLRTYNAAASLQTDRWVTTGGSQDYDASVAMDAYGNVIVVWTDLGAKSPYGTGVFYGFYRLS